MQQAKSFLMKKYWSSSAILILLLIALGVLTGPAFIKQPPFPLPPHLKWAHKGCGHYNAYHPAHFESAYRQGFTGIEMDLLVRDQEIMVQHDKIENQHPLTFPALLQEIKHLQLHLWLDIKTGFDTHPPAIDQLIAKIQQYPDFPTYVIVETNHFKMMRALKKHNIPVAYRIRYFNGSLFNRTISFIKNNIYILLIRPDALAMPSHQIPAHYNFIYKHHHIITWCHQPVSPARVNSIMQMHPEVRAILMECLLDCP